MLACGARVQGGRACMGERQVGERRGHLQGSAVLLGQIGA